MKGVPSYHWIAPTCVAGQYLCHGGLAPENPEELGVHPGQLHARIGAGIVGVVRGHHLPTQCSHNQGNILSILSMRIYYLLVYPCHQKWWHQRKSILYFTFILYHSKKKKILKIKLLLAIRKLDTALPIINRR